MTDVLAKGLAWMHRQRAAHMTSPAAYRRRGESGAGVAVVVTPSQVRRELVTAGGIPVVALVMDFIVDTGALAAEPAAGDWIEFNGRRYEVTEFGEDRCWRWTDASRLARRIHTRDIGEAGGT
jgi:hypothetical protein